MKRDAIHHCSACRYIIATKYFDNFFRYNFDYSVFCLIFAKIYFIN